MRTKTNNEEFDYVLLCNKVCGAAHYNMKMKVVVVEQAEYDVWLSQQNTFVQPESPEAEGVAEVTSNILGE